jgi:ethylmalonyl-CoA mutase
MALTISPPEEPMTAGRTPDRPWLMRTYSGHSSAKASNELYRGNLAKGQTGLSVAFDLPTQTGYDADHVLARGEVGKVGVPVCSIDDMRTLFDGIPLGQMNTSMTINATAAWLLSLYVAAAGEQGADPATLQGTTQNDIIKEYLSRGTYVFPPGPSMRLTADVVTYTVREIPKWNPMNVCSYHLQEVGATPEQEVAYALATATAVLDEVRASGQVAEDEFASVVGRISFFVNAGIRFVSEVAKLRAFTELWDEVCRERYGVTDPKLRRFRYGVQVNSLGLTEAQPENNISRILVEMLAVTLSKGARARAVQLPAWNEALGLPRPWDQQLSLRMQQILAYETDLLEHGDLFDGGHVMAGLVEEVADGARAEYRKVLDMGGAVEAVDYMKGELVRSNAARIARIEAGEQTVVGVNKFTESEPSPLMAGVDGGFLKVDPASEAEQIERLEAFRATRDAAAVRRALDDLKRAVDSGENVMPTSIAAARAGVTTGEWTDALRAVFGEYRGPTGVGGGTGVVHADVLTGARAKVGAAEERIGRKVRLLVAKPGLDGHSSGAEQVAVRARDAGFEVVYEGIRLTPAQIVRAAVDEDVDVVGLSILSGSHASLVPEILDGLRADGLDIPVVVGGIIPADDAAALREAGVAAVYTPKDYEVTRLVGEIADLVVSS